MPCGTSEGDPKAYIGWWIIFEKGAFYIRTPDLFQDTYEEVKDE